MVARDNLREILLGTQAIKIFSLKISIKIRYFLEFKRQFHQNLLIYAYMYEKLYMSGNTKILG